MSSAVGEEGDRRKPRTTKRSTTIPQLLFITHSYVSNSDKNSLLGKLNFSKTELSVKKNHEIGQSHPHTFERKFGN
jgi:hypothetical protein